ncbi:MAG: efflux RND transporter permease subunit [Anaerovoracaceae bacterium]
MSKFSVKKPYTIFVIVILIIVFGVVSFTRMTPDLFPSLDLPYAMVITTAPGQTAEEVETKETKPMEQQLSTLQNLKGILSTTSEGSSMIMMEFDNDANLDTISVDIRDKIDLVSGSFDDSVMKPLIIKMNPEMMPITVAAVTIKGKSTVEVSDILQEELLRQLEGTDGIASVNPAGMVDNTVYVKLNKKKIDKTNKRITKAITSKLDKAEATIAGGESKIKGSTNSIKTGQKEIKKAQKDLAGQRGMINNALDSIKALQTSKENILMINPLADVSQIDAQINQIIKQLRPVSKQLKTMGIDLDKIKTSSYATASAKNSFNTYMDMTFNELSNNMSQMAGTEAYLNSILADLQSSQNDLKAQKKSIEKSSDIRNIITPDTIAGIIQGQNFKMPAGFIEGSGDKMVVTVGEEIKGISQVRELPVLDFGVSDSLVTLNDVADVSYTNNGEESYSKINGKDGILLTFNKQSDASTTAAAQSLQAKFKTLEEKNPGLKFVTLSDSGSYITMVIGSVLQNLLLGAILSILILIFFLRDIRPTIITAISIPISLIFAIVLMYFTGVTINVISLAGLAVGVGMLVDNSIVVIENIYRLRNEGVGKIEAAVKGATQVSGAIIASTLTTICVFVPIVFVQGLTRELFTDMALTVTYSLLASLFIAITLVPALGQAMLKHENKKTVLSTESKVVLWYKDFLHTVLHKKALVLILAVVLLLGSTAIAIAKGFEFIPSMPTEEISVNITMPKVEDLEKNDGTVSASERDAEYRRIGNIIAGNLQKNEAVETVGIMVGEGGPMMMLGGGGDVDFSTMSMYVLLKKDKIKENQAVTDEIKKLGEKYGCEMEVSGEASVSFGALGGGDINIEVYSDNLDDLRAGALQVEKALRSVKGTEKVSEVEAETSDEIRIDVDKEEAMKYGLTVAQVFQQVSSALTEEKKSTEIQIDDANRDVVISAPLSSKKSAKTEEDSIKTLEDIRIKSEGGQGEVKTTTLGEIAIIETDKSLSTINHSNQKRNLTVSADLKDGYNITKVTDVAKYKVAKLELPSGVTAEFSGQEKEIMDAMKQLVLMLALGILMIYLIMVAQFQSLKSPFIVMFAVPLAFTGGMLALIITNKPISVVSMIGFVVLVGIIVNNAIVLISYINQLREEGVGKIDSIITAGATRLRPVLMTAITTVLGLMPLALGLGAGSKMMQPVAIVCVGGLIYATLMTLIVVPIMYDILNKKK